MHTSCRHTDITNITTIYSWVEDCIMRHKSRYDFRDLLLRHGLSKDEYQWAITNHNYLRFEPAIREIAEEAAEGIRTHNIRLPPIKMARKYDATSRKERLICCECAMQQVYDYIAVYGAMEIFKRRMVREQCSSLPRRGQIYGVKMISDWIKSDNHAAEYATEHGYRYTRKCAYFVKLDIRQCYPTASAEAFMRHFSKECGNADLVWLWETLLASHHVDGYNGFAIGALISQWACQYMISFIYRYARTTGRERRGKWMSAVNHMVMFMDDMLMIGSNRAQLKRAVERTIAYAREEFGWEIKPTWNIRELDKYSVDMMGYVVRKDGSVRIRSGTFVRARRMLLRTDNRITLGQARRIVSYKGFFDHSDSRGAWTAYHGSFKMREAKRIIRLHDKQREADKS